MALEAIVHTTVRLSCVLCFVSKTRRCRLRGRGEGLSFAPWTLVPVFCFLVSSFLVGEKGIWMAKMGEGANWHSSTFALLLGAYSLVL